MKKIQNLFNEIILRQDIKQYLIENNATEILEENASGSLKESSRRKLIRHITDYQTLRFGTKPSQEQKMSIATAAGFLFKSLSSVSENILFLFDCARKYSILN